jgi:hypothetical protein
LVGGFSVLSNVAVNTPDAAELSRFHRLGLNLSFEMMAGLIRFSGSHSDSATGPKATLFFQPGMGAGQV